MSSTFFNSEQKSLNYSEQGHCFKIVTKFPERWQTLNFENYVQKLKLLFVVYTEFESNWNQYVHVKINLVAVVLHWER